MLSSTWIPKLAVPMEELANAVVKAQRDATVDAVKAYAAESNVQISKSNLRGSMAAEAVGISEREWQVQIRKTTKDEMRVGVRPLGVNEDGRTTPGVAAPAASQVTLMQVKVIGPKSIKEKTVSGLDVLKILGKTPMTMAMDKLQSSFVTRLRELFNPKEPANANR